MVDSKLMAAITAAVDKYIDDEAAVSQRPIVRRWVREGRIQLVRARQIWSRRNRSWG